MPVGGRQVIPRIKRDELRAAVSAVFDIADEFLGRHAEIEKSTKFTANGKLAELSDAVRKEFAPRWRSVQQPIIAAMQGVESRSMALKRPAPDPANLAAALERQEIRAWLRGLSLEDRTQTALATKDDRIIEAILSAPAELSLFPADRFEHLVNVDRERRAGPAGAELAELQADIDEARSAIKVALGEAQRGSGMPFKLFSDVVDNRRQGSPWLKRDGDKVVVITPGEGSGSRSASAEDLALGKFYQDHAAYIADRPEGFRPAAAA